MVVLGGEVVAYERGIPVDLALDLVLHEDVDNRRVAWPLSLSLSLSLSHLLSQLSRRLAAHHLNLRAGTSIARIKQAALQAGGWAVAFPCLLLFPELDGFAWQLTGVFV